MQTEFENVLIEDIEAPIETAVQYREFGAIAKRLGGAIIAAAMLLALPSLETSKVIAENVSIASLTCNPATSFLRKNGCDMPALGQSGDILAKVIKTQ